MQPTSSLVSPLQQAEIDIQIYTPIANTRLTQTFVNHTDDIIEAVYNFPVPRQAVIMGVVVTINGEVFSGQIKPAEKAEQAYEEGIEDGKRSVLVRDIGDGQHELRAGNLAPEDCLIVEITIAQLMQAQAGGYRYFLPTVVAPKYGDTRDRYDVANEHSILASYPFSANLSVAGKDGVACMSHALQKKDKHYLFSGSLDQDIVLTVASSIDFPHIIQTLKRDYPCGLAVLPPQERVQSESVASIVVLIDCSGSMTGLAIQQTRAGLSALLTEIPEGSEVSLMCFGSSVMHVTKKPLNINSKNRKVLLDYVSNIKADMGGTELWDALNAAQEQCKQHENTPEIILLTDGQVWENTAFFKALKANKNEPSRINTIGIGSAVSDDIVIRLAEATDGQWMLVHPNEPMDERICHFIAQVSAPRIACLWEADSTLWHSLPSSSSEAHGATGFVVYKAKPITHDIALNNEVLHETELSDELSLALQKLVGQQQVRSLNKTDAEALSLKLGLVNRHTSFIMVHEQSVENADGLPTLVVVPQMMVNNNQQTQASSRPGAFARRSRNYSISESASNGPTEYLSLPPFLRRTAHESATNEIDIQQGSEKETPQNTSKKGLLKRLFSRTSPNQAFLMNVDKKLSRTLSKQDIPTLEQLIKWGLNNDIAVLLKAHLTPLTIAEQSALIAKVLIWLDTEPEILSATSKEVLEDKITESVYEDFVVFSDFLDEFKASNVEAD